MPKKKTSVQTQTVAEIERSIHIIRGQRVILDADLAALYGVTTKPLNQQVTRNKDRFPDDFAYQLTPQEFSNLKSQIVTSSSGHGGRRKRPWVFTELGVAMLSSVLNSPTAVRVNIEIMRTFVRLRRLMATPEEHVEQITKLVETVRFHDNEIRIISRVLLRMIAARAGAGALLNLFERDQSVLVFRIASLKVFNIAIDVSITFFKDPAAGLVDFFDDLVFHHSSPSNSRTNNSSGVTITGVSRPSSWFALVSRLMTSPFAMWRQFHVTR
jgi:hypothetical protein